MTEYTPGTEEVRKYYRGGAWLLAKRCPQQFDRQANDETYYPEFDRWLSELIRKEREEAWDEAHREVRTIPHWWNTEDQYGEFDIPPLGPDETSEHGAFMEVRRVLSENPYRKE